MALRLETKGLAFLDILSITPRYPSRETRRRWYGAQARPIDKLSARLSAPA